MPSPLALRWSTVVLILVTAGGVAAAMYWHSLRQRQQWQQQRTMPSDLRWQGPPQEDDAWDDLDALAGGSDDPLNGLISLDRLPEDIALPAGLAPRGVVQRQLPGQTEIQADFQAGGDVQQWLEQIAASLAQSGWTLATSEVAQGPAAVATFSKERDILNIRLQQADESVNIVLVLQRFE